MSKPTSKQTDAEPQDGASETVVAQVDVLDPEPADPDFKLPEAQKDSDYATFQSLRAKDLWVTLRSTEMTDVKTAGGATARVRDTNQSAYPDGPFTAKFSMGKFRSNEKEIILGMLRSRGFGVNFSIDTGDPTGFWRRHKVVKEREVKTTTLDVEQDLDQIRILTGTISAGDKSHLSGA